MPSTINPAILDQPGDVDKQVFKATIVTPAINDIEALQNKQARRGDGVTIFEASPVEDPATQFESGSGFAVDPNNQRHFHIQVHDADTPLTDDMTVSLQPALGGWETGDRVTVKKGDASAYTVTVAGFGLDGAGTYVLVGQGHSITAVYVSTANSDGPGAAGQQFWPGPIGGWSGGSGDIPDADEIAFDPAGSNLTATDVEAAIKQLDSIVANLEAPEAPDVDISVEGTWDSTPATGNVATLSPDDFWLQGEDQQLSVVSAPLVGETPASPLDVRLPMPSSQHLGVPIVRYIPAEQTGEVVLRGPDQEIIAEGVTFTGDQSSANLDTRYVRPGDPVSHPELAGGTVIVSVDVVSETVGQITVSNTASSSDPGTLTITTSWADFGVPGGPRSFIAPRPAPGYLGVIISLMPIQITPVAPPVWVTSERGMVVAIPFVFGGIGEEIEAGETAAITLASRVELLSWTLLGSPTGSIEFDVEIGTYADWPTLTSIVASAPPSITSGDKATDDTLAGWTRVIPGGSVLKVTVDSATDVTFASLTLLGVV